MRLRDFALIDTQLLWKGGKTIDDRVAIDDDGRVRLDSSEDPSVGSPPADPGELALPRLPSGGLAFDSRCRVFVSRPAVGQIFWSLWSAGGAVGTRRPAKPRIIPFVAEVAAAGGDFDAVSETPLLEPRGITIDDADRLYVAEVGRARVLVYDLVASRLVAEISVAFPSSSGGPNPRVVDLDFRNGHVYALLESGDVAVLRSRAVLGLLRAPASSTAPLRLAVSPDGAIVVLSRAGTEGASITLFGPPDPDYVRETPTLIRQASIPLPRATDLVFDGTGALVVARWPGESFVRRSAETLGRAEGRLDAPGYEGDGIALTPDGRVGFWTSRGFRHAFRGLEALHPTGTIITPMMDGLSFQRRWGRLFIDACLPNGTSIKAHCATSDDPNPPPAFPPEELGQDLLLRPSGKEVPWWSHDDGDPRRTYEAPIVAPPGRYLWVALELRGDTRSTPEVHGLRAEFPAHEHMRRLPRIFSANEEAAGFLHRYLAILDGLFQELSVESSNRHLLIHPCSAPEEVLPWLAGFIGLVLDERWPAAAKRTLVSEAASLFRCRGTVRSLQRFIEIFVDAPVHLIEHFRIRGMGGVLLGDLGSAFTTSVLGAGFRVGGAVGAPGEAPLTGTVDDAYQRHAHRFTVLVSKHLTPDEIQIVERILDVHRPAHTIFDICTVGAGLRVGTGAHVGLSAMVGRTAGFRELQLGNTRIGRDALVGRAGPRAEVGGHLDRSTRVR